VEVMNRIIKAIMAKLMEAVKADPHNWVAYAEAAVKQINASQRARMGANSSPDLQHEGISNVPLMVVNDTDMQERDAVFLSAARVKVSTPHTTKVHCSTPYRSALHYITPH
jgi:hypothetical protein